MIEKEGRGAVVYLNQEGRGIGLRAAAGCSPARRARSTAASVWPLRRNTPASWAYSGFIWPGRPNDLIVAAEKITPEQVNFMLKNARGVLCVPLTISRCRELELNEVAFVFAVFVVDHYHHFALAEVFNRIFDAVQVYFIVHCL